MSLGVPSRTGDTATEVPWPTEENQPCWMTRTDHGRYWYLWFRNPRTGGRSIIPVAESGSWERDEEPVWHAEVVGKLIKVSPSIHALGDFHSPNPVYFRLDWEWWQR